MVNKKVLLILTVGLAISFSVPAEALWLSDYEYRKEITIDHTKIGSDLSNFPLAVILSDTTNIVDGYDVKFTSSDGTSLLDYEMENYAVNDATYWVNLPTVSSGADTTFYMYYGKTGDTDGSTTAVWDDSYKMVQHLQETDVDGGSGDIKDSTANHNDGTTSGMDSGNQTGGYVNGGFSFDGVNEYVEIPDNESLDISGSITLESWFKAAETDYGTQENPGRSAMQILRYDDSATTGTYWIDPDGPGGVEAFQAYCDMSLIDGGWTIFAEVNTASCSLVNTGNYNDHILTYDGKLSNNKYSPTSYSQTASSNIALTKLIEEADNERFDFMIYDYTAGIQKVTHDEWYVLSSQDLARSDGFNLHTSASLYGHKYSGVGIKHGWQGGSSPAIYTHYSGSVPGDSDYIKYYGNSSYSAGNYKMFYGIRNLETTFSKDSAYGIRMDESGVQASINYLNLEAATSSGDWNYVTLTYDIDNSLVSLYVNGVLAAQDTFSSTIGINSNDLDIGRYFNGIMDEVRISDTARSEDWIAASYYSGSNTLLSFGSQEGGVIPEPASLLLLGFGVAGIALFKRRLS